MAWNLNDYEEVKDRLPRFWADHPNGSVRTEMVFREHPVVVFKAWLCDEAGRIIADGHAEEIYGQGKVNETSALENCETSAIGRALANAKWASGPNRPSREEMRKAARADSPGGVGRDRGDSRPSTTPGRPASNDEDEAWLNFAENPAGWWDNRKDKRNPKAPDLKAKKGTEVAKDGLWLSNLKKRHHGEEPVEVDEFLSERNCLGVAIEDWAIDTVAGYVALMLGVEPEPKAERKKTMRTDDVAAELGAEVVDDGRPF